MEHNYWKVLIIVLGFYTTCKANNPTPYVVNTTGNTLKSTQLEITYSVGEISIITLVSKSIQITQGYLQPYKSFITAFIYPADEAGYPVLYPVPAEKNIHITNANNIAQLSLFDVTGQQVLYITKVDNNLQLDKIPAGTYTAKYQLKNSTQMLFQKIVKF